MIKITSVRNFEKANLKVHNEPDIICGDFGQVLKDLNYTSSN